MAAVWSLGCDQSSYLLHQLLSLPPGPHCYGQKVDNPAGGTAIEVEVEIPEEARLSYWLGRKDSHA